MMVVIALQSTPGQKFHLNLACLGPPRSQLGTVSRSFFVSIETTGENPVSGKRTAGPTSFSFFPILWRLHTLAAEFGTPILGEPNIGAI